MDPITVFKGTSVAIPIENIDTDQITPARYLMGTGKELKDAFFADWRKKDPLFALNQPGAKGASILVAGHNYGCGSSREHAVWAAADFGIRAVVSTSIADIHRNNLPKSRIVPAVLDAASHPEVIEAAKKNLEITVDLPNQVLVLPSGRKAPFSIDPFVKRCLIEGWEEIDYLLTHAAQVSAFEAARA